MICYKNFIDGAFIDSNSDATFENRNPANPDDIIGIFPLSTEDDCTHAIASAKKAYPGWKNTPAPQRSEIMRKAADILIRRKEELSQLMCREMGKVLKECRGDVQEAIDTALIAAHYGRNPSGFYVPSELRQKTCVTKREPLGVWGCICPWNFPMAIPAWKLFPCLTSGNTAIIKPASDTPASAAALVSILHEAGIPPGVVNILFGTGKEIGECLLHSHDVVGISFTGSSETGKHIAKQCGQSLKRCSLELGGKNGQIVLADAHLDLALDGILWGAFGTSGQRCTATSRLILHESIYDEFVSRLIHRVSRLQLGNGLHASTDIGPLVSQKQQASVMKYIEIGKNEGASLIAGGSIAHPEGCENGWFVEPTLFADVTPSMQIAQQEIFGPVLSVLKAHDFDHCLELLNGTSYGLSASIYTNNITHAQHAIDRAETGIVYVNAPTIGAECHLPFGGYKNTGNGHREGGWTAYEIFTEIKTIYTDYSSSLQKAQIDTWNT